MTEFLELAWVQRTVFVLGGLFVGLVLERIVVYRARRIALKTRFKWDDLIVNSLHGVAAIWCVSGGVYLALGVGEVDPRILSTANTMLTVLVMGSVVVAGMRLAGGAANMRALVAVAGSQRIDHYIAVDQRRVGGVFERMDESTIVSDIGRRRGR